MQMPVPGLAAGCSHQQGLSKKHMMYCLADSTSNMLKKALVEASELHVIQR